MDADQRNFVYYSPPCLKARAQAPTTISGTRILMPPAHREKGVTNPTICGGEPVSVAGSHAPYLSVFLHLTYLPTLQSFSLIIRYFQTMSKTTPTRPSRDAFVSAALAACAAVCPRPPMDTTLICFQTTMSNPAEVAKTRLQLQGELMRNGYQRVYSNAFDAIGKTFRAEGVRGIQRGLTAAYAYSVWRSPARLVNTEPC